MNVSSNLLSLVTVGDEGLWRTNPVWCLDRLVDVGTKNDRLWLTLPERLRACIRVLSDQGIYVPPEAPERWKAADLPNSATKHGGANDLPCPGVVGLVVDPTRKIGWVVPLE